MRRGLGVGLVVAIVALVLWRALAHPVDTYGDSAAGYIEHLERVRVLSRLSETGDGWLGRLRRSDGLYPPLLHILSAPAAWLGQQHPASVTGLGAVWLALTGLGASLVARRLDPRAAGPAFVATLLIPALHAVAPRYYYDLPMTALVWLSAALMAHSRRPMSGALAGLLFALACGVKWSALPLGLGVLAAGAWLGWSHTRSWRPALAAVAVTGVLVVTAIFGGSTSWGAMGGATFQPPPGLSLPDWSAPLDSWRPGLGHALGAMAIQARIDGLDRLLFYVHRLATTVISPALWLPGLAVVGLWIASGARAWSALAIAVVPTFAFVWLVVPPLDERFLLTLLPWLGVLTGLALANRRRWTSGLEWGAGLIAVAVAADFHTGPSTPFDTPPTPATQGLEVPWRLGLSTSADRRGWARKRDVPDHQEDLRKRVLAIVRRCGSTSITGSDRVISPTGDLNWWTFELERAALVGEAPPTLFLPVGSPLGPPPTAPTVHIIPSPVDRFGPAEPAPPEYVLLSDSPPHIDIFAAPGHCASNL